MPGLHVVDAADIHVAGAALAEIGEPEAAVLVEDEVVRTLQLVLAALVEHRLDLAALQVDALRSSRRYSRPALADPAS